MEPWLVWLSGLWPACKLKDRWFDSHQGRYLGWGPGLQLGMCERQPVDVSLTHGPFLPFSLPSLFLKINI